MVELWEDGWRVVEKLVQMYGPVTLEEEEGRVKALVSEHKKAF